MHSYLLLVLPNPNVVQQLQLHVVHDTVNVHIHTPRKTALREYLVHGCLMQQTHNVFSGCTLLVHDIPNQLTEQPASSWQAVGSQRARTTQQVMFCAA